MRRMSSGKIFPVLPRPKFRDGEGNSWGRIHDIQCREDQQLLLRLSVSLTTKMINMLNITIH